MSASAPGHAILLREAREDQHVRCAAPSLCFDPGLTSLHPCRISAFYHTPWYAVDCSHNGRCDECLIMMIIEHSCNSALIWSVVSRLAVLCAERRDNPACNSFSIGWLFQLSVYFIRRCLGHWRPALPLRLLARDVAGLHAHESAEVLSALEAGLLGREGLR